MAKSWFFLGKPMLLLSLLAAAAAAAVWTGCDIQWYAVLRVHSFVMISTTQRQKISKLPSYLRMIPTEKVTSSDHHRPPILLDNRQMVMEIQDWDNNNNTDLTTTRTTSKHIPSKSNVAKEHILGRGTSTGSLESIKSPILKPKKSRPNSEASAKEQRHKKPYRADYETSKQSQKRIQSSVYDKRLKTPLDRATAVLETFLNISPHKCNAANIICALTLSAKTIGCDTNDHFRDLLFRTNTIVQIKLQDHSLSPRQLCNAVWALAKHYDRDEQILPVPPHPTALSNTDTMYGKAEVWDLRNNVAGCPAHNVDTTIDEIAQQLTTIVRNDVYAAKEGELCMACWAFGVLRRRRKPPGWQHGPQISKIQNPTKQTQDSSNFVKFEQWNANSKTVYNNDAVDSMDESEDATITGAFLDSVGRALSASISSRDKDNNNNNNNTAMVHSDRIRRCTWSELANVAWAFAAHGRACSGDAELLLNKIGQEATRRLNEPTETNIALSRDIAQLIWSLGVLQADNFRLGDTLVDFVSAVTSTARSGGGAIIEFRHWSCPDIGQVVLALAHARIDDPFLVDSLFTEACRRFGSEGQSTAYRWKSWEVSVLLWAQARLYLTESRGPIYSEFAKRAIADISASLHRESSFQRMGIGPQEQANIAWSLTVLDLYKIPSAVELLKVVYAEAASSCQRDKIVQLEHAHQLWQSLFILQDECPSCTTAIPAWFREYLEKQWSIEKSRPKISSARHLSISKTLTLMGVAHYNEHDEDIDVAIVLKTGASWTHETEASEVQAGVRVAVEFDGPYHFTRPRGHLPGSKAEPPRALGHTVLKYRLLKKQGWTVVRVPYYEYDKIPFWASMERQRYLQRLLKTHVNLRFSRVDRSSYKAQVPNRGSRFD